MSRGGYFKGYGPYRMSGHRRFQDTTLFLALALWMCTLPLLAIFAIPFLGWKVTAYLAGFLLAVDLVACWFLCTFPQPQRPEAGRLRENDN